MAAVMDFATQDVVDGDCSYEDVIDRSIWGKLYPLASSFSSLDLSKDEYSFGRGDTCDYSFCDPGSSPNKCFLAYSKIHFKLVRENSNTGTHVILVDLSSNGTFVNGEKIGKGKKQALSNNDEIALALKKNKAFVYMDMSMGEDSKLPQELTEKYTLTRTIGKGACGEVKLAFRKGSCQKFAVKVISKQRFSIAGKKKLNLSQQVMREVQILKALKHPCIIAVEDVVDTDETLYIVLELVEGGELFDRVVEHGQLTENVAKLLFYQMALAIQYLHKEGVTHRDLKPENILLHNDNTECLVKVTDFGLSKFIDSGSIMKTFCGTPTYLAPEILITAGSGSYTNAVDVWSLGVIPFICLVGYPPFSTERTDMPLSKQIIGAHYTFTEKFWRDISEDAKDLIRKMLTVDPNDRITIAQVLGHSWLQNDDIKRKAETLMTDIREDMLPPKLPVNHKRPSDETNNGCDSKRRCEIAPSTPKLKNDSVNL